MIERCPRCREPIRKGASWTPMQSAPGRATVFQVQHRKGDGRICVAYLGERWGTTQPQHQLAGFGASVFSVAEALNRRAK